jgi:hypothetical protein
MKIDTLVNDGRNNSSLIIIIASIITVIAFMEIIPDKMKINDSVDYFSRYKPSAENIYHNFDFETIEYYVPGYPIIICFSFLLSDIFGIDINLSNHLFQLLFFIISALLIFKIGNLFFRKKFALLPSLIWISYPPNLYMMKQSTTPSVPFIALLFYIVYLFLKLIKENNFSKFNFFYLGMLIGILMYIKPTAIGLGFIFTIVIFVTLKSKNYLQRTYLSLVLLLGIELIILPWQAFIYKQTDKFVFLMPNSIMMIKDGLVFNQKTDSRIGIKLSDDVEQISVIVKKNWHQLKDFSGLVNVLTPYFNDSPISFIKLFFIKVIRSFYGLDSHRYESLSLIMQAVYIAVIIRGIIFSFNKSMIMKKYFILISFIFIYFLANAVAVVPILRYINPPLGLFFIFIPFAFFKYSNLVKG